VRAPVCHLVLKRLIDLIGSSVGLLLLSPLAMAIAVAIWLTDRGSVLFRQERAGLNGKPFVMYKFRTMKEGSESGTVVCGDPRITSAGRLLRTSSLDEIPQLINVLKGEMSLVGPRPDRPSHAEGYSERVRGRLKMKPGIMGLAQLHHGRRLTWEERYEYDLEYVERFTIWLDLRITLASVFLARMFQREG